MKLFGIQAHEECKNVNFEGKRVNRNIVAQLTRNNPYSLNEPNQRLITNAITELGKVPGLKNIKFLMNTAAKSAYSTNIELKDTPKHDWRGKLIASALAALGLTTAASIDTADWADKIMSAGKKKNLNNDEKHILKLREEILKNVDLEQIKRETVGGEQDFENNLDYFIISSETTKEHKKYVLEKLKYFLSDKYEINPQLKDKKSIVVAEMVNDMAIATPNHDVPNIKAINQKHHGMCAAISIVRKKLAYEDKPNYVDAILSELDSSNVIKVYDRSRLGSGEKVDVAKVPVDFDAAMKKGYRIIDASTMHWMQIAQMGGYSNGAYSIYNPFDNENFDVKRDSFFNAKFLDPELVPAQLYYQALVKVNSTIEEYKAKKIKNTEENSDKRAQFEDNVKLLGKTSDLLKTKITELLPDISEQELQETVKNVLDLEHDYSSKINKNDKFAYITNEENSVKKDKITAYLSEKLGLTNIDENLADKIADLVLYYHELEAEIKLNKSTKLSKLDEAEELYNIAAGFRYQFLMSLEDPMTLENLIHAENIGNKEANMLNIIDFYINKLENNAGDSDLIIKHFAKVFDDKNPTREDVIEFLGALKLNINTALTQGFDNLYAAMTLGDRKGALITYIDGLYQTLENNSEAVSLNLVASRLGTKTAKKEVVLQALTDLKEKVQNGGEEEFLQAYDLVGNTSQSSFMRSIYQDFIDQLSAEDNKEFVTKFLAAHNLPIEDDEQVAMSVINQISEQVNSITGLLDSYAEILKIKDADGDLLYSPEPKDIVIKRFENNKIVIPAKNLRELQAHFDKILKDKSADEFNSRQGKLNDSSLLKFSNRERETLALIKDNINPYYAQIQKSLVAARTDLKYPLEELNRVIGINSGSWWLTEGHSGLHGANQVRVLEYMTGRPHYMEEDLAKAIETIKTSPFSGISSSSVYHDDNGWHAQYIADIAPVTVKTKDGKEEVKEVLFHDNSWGASESENTWVDSYGLRRTDYSDHRGGTLGYITNDKMRNGNFVERILGDMVKIDKPDTVKSRVYKRIKHPSSGWSTPQYQDIILNGESDNLRDIVEEVRDTMFTPTIKLVDTIQKFIKDMTTEQIKAKIERMKYVDQAYKPMYESLKRRIVPEFAPESVREVKLMSQDEYNQLADDDILKVIVESIALYHNYRLSGKLQDLSSVKNVQELESFRKEQIKRATEDMLYSFGKNKSISAFADDSFTDKDDEVLVSILKKYGIELGEDDLFGMISDYDISKKNFDGSLKNTINTMMEGISKDIRKVVKNEGAVHELEAFLRQRLNENLYFNEEDLEDKEIEHIIKFIDRIYDPADNKEFVKIYRKLQDMTTEEFKREFLSKATPEDLGIKNETGYDVLKKLQRYEEQANTDFLNSVWRREYFKVVHYEPTPASYYYKKLHRRSKDLMKYNFETAYREMNNDLSLLNFEKMFNKYKGMNLEKYGAYPAYPDITEGLLSEDMFKTSWNACIENVSDKVEQIRMTKSITHLFENEEILKKHLKELKSDYVMEGKEYTDLNFILGEIITTLYKEDKMEKACDLAGDLMDIPEGTEFGKYKASIKALISEIENYKNNFADNSLEQIVNVNKVLISKQNEIFVNTLIEKRYQAKVMALVNKYEQGLIKKDPKVEEYKEELWEAFKACHILHNPKEILNLYLESLGSDNKLNPINSNLETLLRRALQFARLMEMQTIVMDAMDKGLEADVKKAFDKVSLETLDGDKIPMGAEEIVSQIVYSLLINDEEQTAIMFLEKFGLNEQFVTDTAKNFNFDNVKKLIDKTVETSDNFSKFVNDYERITADLNKKAENGDNIIRAINQAKREFIVSGKKWDIDKDAMREFLETFDKLKEYIKEAPKVNPTALFGSTINSAMADLAKVESEKWDEVNQTLGGVETICILANKLMLNPDSEAFKVRDEMNKQFEALTEYSKKIQNIETLPEEE